MPQFALADALRYFFSPIVLLFYVFVFDSKFGGDLLDKLGLAGSLAFLVAGGVIYFVYRYLIFDHLIKWLHDRFRAQTYRTWFQENVEISLDGTRRPSHSARAERLYQAVGHRAQNPNEDDAIVRYSGIHLLYQCGILALPFIVFSAISLNPLKAIIFVVIAAMMLGTAVIQDIREEEDELSFFLSIKNEVRDAAKRLRIPVRSQKKEYNLS